MSAGELAGALAAWRATRARAIADGIDALTERALASWQPPAPRLNQAFHGSPHSSCSRVRSPTLADAGRRAPPATPAVTAPAIPTACSYSRSSRRGALAAGSAAVGVLASRFAAEDGDGYWLLGAGLSFAFNLDISELAHAP